MPDLILNINLYESRKKNRLIIETFEGKILHLKSKTFSGPLRKVNLELISQADNLSSIELQNIKKILSNSKNIQIDKSQYVYSTANFSFLKDIILKGCLFCRDKQKGPIYIIEKIHLNETIKGGYRIHDFFVLQNKTELYLNYSIGTQEEFTYEIVPLLYIDIYSHNYKANLFFDYGRSLVKFEDKKDKNVFDTVYRNYKFERDTIIYLKECHWKEFDDEGFVYYGSDIAADMQLLINNGIRLFTNEKKKISLIDTFNVNIKSGIDWFELQGNLKAGDICINLNEFIDFSKKKEDWTEYNGQIIFKPVGVKKIIATNIVDNGNKLLIKKKDILGALELVDFFAGKSPSQHNNVLFQYDSVDLDLSPKLMNTLRNYQKVGVKWLISLYKNGYGGCLADDMGLGKTIQIIAYLSDGSTKHTNALIVVPKTLIENWKREFSKFAPDIATYVYHGIDRNIVEVKKHRIIITTYGTLVNDIDKLIKCEFNHLIIDEAQNVKNFMSKAYKSISLIHANARIIITGTPLENNVKEFWDLMRLVNPTRLSYKIISNGLDNEGVLKKIKKLTSPFLLRRYKREVLEDLPDREEQIIYCNLGESQQKLYDNLFKSIQHEINRKSKRFEIKSNSIILQGLMYLQEICCHPKLLPIEYNINGCAESAKLEQLKSMLMELYAAGHKVIVFSRFTRMLRLIVKEIITNNFKVFYLDGETVNRQNVVDKFEKSPEGIFLISLKAGGVGLNLVSSDTAIIYDPWWNPAIEKQAEDRIYRIGQKNKVTIYKLIAANTIEEKIQKLQETKRKLFDELIEGHSVPKNITFAEIKELFSN